jgi:hypothetical protein
MLGPCAGSSDVATKHAIVSGVGARMKREKKENAIEYVCTDGEVFQMAKGFQGSVREITTVHLRPKK